ncbi:hypothetical protein [Mesorhizobium sp. CN2-181]|uniref:hypothetical protein n=1 Tax=Mesorhizobium yinganensis TaxID=3157707 RepID=UPI0032B74B3F
MGNGLIERSWYALAPDGTGHELVLRIMTPTLHPKGHWVAPTSLGVLEERIHDIAGIDGWQAVGLAMRFTARMIDHYEEKGWQFYWEQDGERLHSSDRFDFA